MLPIFSNHRPLATNNAETGAYFGMLDGFDVPISAKTTSRFPHYVAVDQRIVKANLKFRKSLRDERKLIKKIQGFAVKWLGLRRCKRHLKSYAGRLMQSK